MLLLLFATNCDRLANITGALRQTASNNPSLIGTGDKTSNRERNVEKALISPELMCSRQMQHPPRNGFFRSRRHKVSASTRPTLAVCFFHWTSVWIIINVPCVAIMQDTSNLQPNIQHADPRLESAGHRNGGGSRKYVTYLARSLPNAFRSEDTVYRYRYLKFFKQHVHGRSLQLGTCIRMVCGTGPCFSNLVLSPLF